MAEIEAECVECRGTGIYRGFAEPAGIGVVCLHCRGTGAKMLTYKPFAGRRQRSDVQVVQLSRGLMVAPGVGPGGTSITYAEFLAGKMPTTTKGGAS